MFKIQIIFQTKQTVVDCQAGNIDFNRSSVLVALAANWPLGFPM